MAVNHTSTSSPGLPPDVGAQLGVVVDVLEAVTLAAAPLTGTGGAFARR